MKKTLLGTALALAFVLAPVALSADVLLIDEVRQVDRMTLPENGQSKADVEAAFGEPTRRIGAVGDPPISRWDYGDYSVYFEYDLVLYSVLSAGKEIEEG